MRMDYENGRHKTASRPHLDHARLRLMDSF